MKRLDIDLSKYCVRADGTFKLSDIDPADSQGFQDKKAGRKALEKNRKAIAELQERLFAEQKQSLLLVLQAMDTGGKDSTIRNVTTGLNPQGCRVYSFKAPSQRELSQDFLWRIHKQTPPRGYITIFNRSHYEDVLIVRVHGWAKPSLIEKRYEHINQFERLLSDHGTRIIKVMLYISKAYQLERLQRRLKYPDKWWKFNPGDLEERALWPAYMEAYEEALNRCSTDSAPWYVVPAEKRWFRNLVVSTLMLNTLVEMNPQYPKPSFNPEEFPPESLA